MSLLFDQLLRHQVYLEGLKEGELSRINRKLLTALEKIVAGELKRLPFERLDALSRTGRNALAKRIERAQRKALADWRRDLTASLREYAKADATIVAGVYRQHGKVIKPKLSEVWEDVVNTKVNGPKSTLKAALDKMSNQQMAAMKSAINAAYEDGETVDDILDAIKGTRANGYKDGLFRKYRNDLRANGATMFQHVKGSVHSRVAEGTFSRYRWVSVLDSVTSDICRGRNGKVYTYGDGPQPPAHFHCRSSVVPVGPDIEEPRDRDPPFFEWVQTQPEEFIRDIFPKSQADKLVRGTAKREDFERFEGIGALSLDKFKDKSEII